MHSNMLALRLNSTIAINITVSILHTNKLIKDKLDLKVIANEFISNNDKSKSICG